MNLINLSKIDYSLDDFLFKVAPRAFYCKDTLYYEWPYNKSFFTFFNLSLCGFSPMMVDIGKHEWFNAQ